MEQGVPSQSKQEDFELDGEIQWRKPSWSVSESEFKTSKLRTREFKNPKSQKTRGDQRVWPVTAEETRRKKDKRSNSIRVNNEHMVAHPSEGGSFEEGVEANVDALHGNHGYKWQHIFVTVTSWCHLFVCFVASTMNMNNQFQLFIGGRLSEFSWRITTREVFLIFSLLLLPRCVLSLVPWLLN